ncbi:sterol 3-beta-glucosyltransferase UGT80A2 isoform X1 [Arachis hypogaea]|uniref:sterol 3-beta-glucosyltransferase UGT80A2 isoform X1 n=2 Tax=Arachis hypogaea TaxID=3818 RepID=UPI000DEC2E58|nr:sterol 3-beta-glucosyltransferase UGT80A2 isoform X1 [Arachis hypogaea]
MAESSSNTRLSNSSDEVSVYLDAEPRSTTDIATTSSSSGHVDRDTSITRHSLAEVMAMAEAEAEPAPTRHSRYHRQKSATKVRKNTGIGSIMKFLDENLPAKKRLRFLKRASVIKDDGTVEFDVPRDINPPENIGTTVTSREPCNESGEAIPYHDIHPLQIVMLIVGTRGDVQPFVAIGKRLQEDGHRVRLASHKNFKDFVLSAGLEFYPLGGDPKVLAGYMVKNKGFLPSGRSEIHKQRNQIKAIINSLLPACNSADPDTHVAFNADAIIANPPAYAHTHVAEFLKVPLHIFFTMPWTPTNEFPHPLSRVKQQIAYRLSYQIVDSLIWLGIRDLINEFRKKKLKLRPITYLSGSYTSPPNMPYGYIWSPHLVPKPKDWGPNIDVVGFCFLDLASDYEPPISLLEWLEEGEKEGKKPIYIGFGSLPLEQPDKMTQIIIEALDKTGQRGIINKGWGGLGNLAETKNSVYLLDNCPHDWLFPRCKAVVHHGGAGTTAAGLRAACPTTIVPFFGDQPFWGERVHARGVGPAPIPVDEFTLGRLVDAINYMLKPEVKRNAEELADAMKHEDGVAGAVAAFYKHYHPQTLDSETNHQPVATVPRLGFSFLGCFGLSRSKSTTSR